MNFDSASSAAALSCTFCTNFFASFANGVGVFLQGVFYDHYSCIEQDLSRCLFDYSTTYAFVPYGNVIIGACDVEST